MKKSLLIFALATFVNIASGSTQPVSAQFKRIGADESQRLPKAVVVSSDTLILTSQIFPFDQNGEIESRDDVATQTGKVLSNLGDLLKAEFGRELADVARLCVYVTADEAAPIVRREIASMFPHGKLPTVSCVVTPLPVNGAMVAIDAAVAHRQGIDPLGGVVDSKIFRSSNDSRTTAKNRTVGYYGMTADNAADYASIPSQRLIFVSGQAEPGELRESIRKTWQSLVKTVEWAGADSDHIAHVKVFMNTVDDIPVFFEEVAKVSKRRSEYLPPISFVQWTNKGPTEIEVVAAQSTETDKSSEPVRQLNPPWMTESPVYCKVAVTNSDRLIFTSGLYGKPGSDGEAQVNAIFTELDQLMKSAGSDLKHLAKATYYVANDEVSGKLNTLRPKYYDPKRPPAASKASVTGVGREGCTITLDMIAVPAAK